MDMNIIIILLSPIYDCLVHRLISYLLSKSNKVIIVMHPGSLDTPQWLVHLRNSLLVGAPQLEEAPLGTDAEGGAAESLSRGFGRCCTKVPSSLVPFAIQWLGGSDLELWVFPIQ